VAVAISTLISSSENPNIVRISLSVSFAFILI